MNWSWSCKWITLNILPVLILLIPGTHPASSMMQVLMSACMHHVQVQAVPSGQVTDSCKTHSPQQRCLPEQVSEACVTPLLDKHTSHLHKQRPPSSELGQSRWWIGMQMPPTGNTFNLMLQETLKVFQPDLQSTTRPIWDSSNST